MKDPVTDRDLYLIVLDDSPYEQELDLALGFNPELDFAEIEEETGNKPDRLFSPTNETDQQFIERLEREGAKLSDIRQLQKLSNSTNENISKKAKALLYSLFPEIEKKYNILGELSNQEVGLLREFLLYAPDNFKERTWIILHALSPNKSLIEWVFGRKIFKNNIESETNDQAIETFAVLLDWFLQKYTVTDISLIDFYFYYHFYYGYLMSENPTLGNRFIKIYYDHDLEVVFPSVDTAYVFESIVQVATYALDLFGYQHTNHKILYGLTYVAFSWRSSHQVPLVKQAKELCERYFPSQADMEIIIDQWDNDHPSDVYGEYLVKILIEGIPLTEKELSIVKRHLAIKSADRTSRKSLALRALMILINYAIDPNFDVLKEIFEEHEPPQDLVAWQALEPLPQAYVFLALIDYASEYPEIDLDTVFESHHFLSSLRN